MCFVFFFSFILVDGFFNSAHKIFGVWSDKWSVCALSDFVDLFQFLSSLRSLQINILLLLFFFCLSSGWFPNSNVCWYVFTRWNVQKKRNRSRKRDGWIDREREGEKRPQNRIHFTNSNRKRIQQTEPVNRSNAQCTLLAELNYRQSVLQRAHHFSTSFIVLISIFAYCK